MAVCPRSTALCSPWADVCGTSRAPDPAMQEEGLCVVTGPRGWPGRDEAGAGVPDSMRVLGVARGYLPQPRVYV